VVQGAIEEECTVAQGAKEEVAQGARGQQVGSSYDKQGGDS
jgi:hypothetical protein